MPARPRSSSIHGDRMKPFWLVLTVLFALAGALAVVVVPPRTRLPSDCTSRVVIGRGARGEPVECVCLGGRLSTCFDPGP